MKIFLWFFVATFLFFASASLNNIYSQCPDQITLTVKSVIPSTCASNGIVQLETNAPATTDGQPTLQFRLINPPAGATTGSQNESTFTSLPPGYYTVRAECAKNSANYVETNFTIDALYTPMGQLQADVTSNCNVGTISITNAATLGGSAPLQFIVLPGNDAGYTDAEDAVYTTNTSFTNLAPGDYTVRVKDNCGNIRTIVKTVLATAVARDVNFIASVNNNMDCNNPKYTFNLSTLIDPSTGNTVDLSYYDGLGGIKVQVFQANADCSKNASAPLSDVFTWKSNAPNSIGVTPSATLKYYIEVLTPPCNIPYGKCVDYSSLNLAPELIITTTTAGCNNSISPATMTIGFDYNRNMVYPLHVTVTNSIGNIVGDISGIYDIQKVKFENLPHDTYTVNVYDKCNNLVKTQQINDVTGSGTPKLGLVSSGLNCVTKNGTVNVILSISGYLAGLTNISEIKIVDVSSGLKNNSDYNYIGVPGKFDPTTGYLYFDTLRAGTYTIQITTPCGDPVLLTYTVNSTTLLQKIAAQGTSVCNSGGTVGIISSQTSYNGWGTPSYILMDANTNTKVNIPDNPNTLGIWANLPAGNYKINMGISGYCNNSGYYEVSSNTVTILGGSTLPTITKKLGSICEDPVTGALQTKGAAYLEFDGIPPFKLEYKDHTSSTWLLAADPTTSPTTIGNLDPYKDYDIKVTSCGSSTETSVSIGQLAPYRIAYNANPCEGQAFTMTLPLSTGATYQWNNPAGAVVSTSNTLSFNPYTSANDGQYSSIVSFGSCVIRKDTVTLSSSKCGQPLPIRLTKFFATGKNCITLLSWTIVNQPTDAYITVEASKNGKDFTAIKSINVESDKNTYSYTDNSAQAYQYYRLKMFDIDGTSVYSNIIQTSSCGNNSNSDMFTLAPNPVRDGSFANLVYTGNEVKGHYEIYNVQGQKMFNGNTITLGGTGQSKITIQVQSFARGMYIVSFVTTEGETIYRGKLIVQ